MGYGKRLWGDCLEIMPQLPDKSIDMILCDLPYGTTACKWDTVIPFEPLWAQYKRLIKDNGAIVLTASQPFTSALVMSNPKWFKYELIWVKDKPSNFALANLQPMKYHENILVFYGKPPTFNKQMQQRTGSGANRCKYIVDNSHRVSDHNNILASPKMFNPESKNPGSILNYSTGRRQDIHHPTQKPVALFEYLIRTYTNEGDMVLDNCAGSFTTAIACINTNRKYICIEKDTDYFRIGSERIKNHLISLGKIEGDINHAQSDHR